MNTESRTLDGACPAGVPLRPLNPAPRILVLDDDEDIREICVEALAHSGYQVDAAADGEAGWEALQARQYDLLITDNEMPKLSGLDVVKKIFASGMRLEVIFASGSLSPRELQLTSPLPIAAALPKPFSPNELVKAVRRVLCGNEMGGLASNCSPSA
jgi:two-component system OmpR family response regulator